MTNELMMSAHEFLRLSKMLKQFNFDGDLVLKMIEYVESGDENLLAEILKEGRQKDNADGENK